MACYQTFGLPNPRCPFCGKILRHKFGKKEREVKCTACHRLVVVEPIPEEPAYAVEGLSDDDISLDDPRFFTLDACLECGLKGNHTTECTETGGYTTCYTGSTLERPVCPLCYAEIKVKKSCVVTCGYCSRSVTVYLMTGWSYNTTGYTDDDIPRLLRFVYVSHPEEP